MSPGGHCIGAAGAYCAWCKWKFNEKGHWRSPRSLRELFAESFEDHVVKEMKEHVDDVRMDVFEMAGLPVDVRKRFRSDMRVIVDYLAEGKDYDPGDRVIRHPEAFLWMLYALTGDVRYKKFPPVRLDNHLDYPTGPCIRKIRAYTHFFVC